MTKVYGSLVIKNEANRYLRSCLQWMSKYLDTIFIYDDQSTDSSAKIASEFGTVVVRPDNVPSFIENESAFRFAAWQSFEQMIKPQPGEWILSFDADEFLVSAKSMDNAIRVAQERGCVGVSIPFPEVFDIRDGIPYVRTDGLWATIRGPRLFEYQPGGEWNQKTMGCGSEPSYVARGRVSHNNFDLTVLHFGYAHENDRRAKWDRYSSLSFHGHNDAHIKSIVEPPTLVRWDGEVPEVRYGS